MKTLTEREVWNAVGELYRMQWTALALTSLGNMLRGTLARSGFAASGQVPSMDDHQTPDSWQLVKTFWVNDCQSGIALPGRVVVQTELAPAEFGRIRAWFEVLSDNIEPRVLVTRQLFQTEPLEALAPGLGLAGQLLQRLQNEMSEVTGLRDDVLQGHAQAVVSQLTETLAY